MKTQKVEYFVNYKVVRSLCNQTRDDTLIILVFHPINEMFQLLPFYVLKLTDFLDSSQANKYAKVK